MVRRLALMSGGCSGIGFAAARLLATDHDVALAYASNHSRASIAVEELERLHPDATIRAYGHRLRSYDDARALMTKVVDEFGRPPAVLVNSVGGTNDALFMSSDFASHEEVVREHLIVAMALAHCVIGGMYKTRFGRIVNLSSISARYAKRGQTSYAAVKAGIEGFSRTLAVEVAHRGVTVNIVAPGLIETAMTKDFIARLSRGERRIEKAIPVGSLGKPEDVADLIAFVCSDKARYITGAVLTVDGGRSLGDTSL